MTQRRLVLLLTLFFLALAIPTSISVQLVSIGAKLLYNEFA